MQVIRRLKPVTAPIGTFSHSVEDKVVGLFHKLFTIFQTYHYKYSRFRQTYQNWAQAKNEQVDQLNIFLFSASLNVFLIEQCHGDFLTSKFLSDP
jgi:hypothetical protein